MLANLTSGLAKMECEPVAKSVSREPDGEDQVGLVGQGVGGRGALQADAADLPPRPALHGALAAEGFPDRGADGGGQLLELGGGVGVDHPAAGDDDRLLRASEKRCDSSDLVGVGGRPADDPVPLVEELGREVVGVGLHVLRQGQHHGAGLDRVDQGADRGRQRGQQLLGAGDPVEEPADRPEHVVHGQVGIDRVLQLLQHRALVPGGVGVTGQQEHRQPVHRGQRGAGDQVHRTRVRSTR